MLAQKHQILLDSIHKLMRRGASQNVSNILKKTSSVDLGVVFRLMNPQELDYLFTLLVQLENAPQLIEKLDVPIVAQGLQNLAPEKIASLLKQIEVDDAADILGELPEELSELVLPLMKEEGKEVEELLQYRDDSAGGIMNPHVFALSEDLTVKESISRLQESDEAQMVFYLYVVDEFHNLVGVLNLRQLILSKPNTELKEIMTSDVVRVDTETDQEEVARLVARHKYLAIPVVDQNNRLMGIITVDDIIDVIREEATEDFLKMAGAGEDALRLPSVVQSTKQRFPWLTATLIGGAVAAEVIGHYQDLITRISILSGFIPVIIGMGGNLGTQSSTIMVRGLATGRIQHGHLWHVIWKEVRVALVLGITFGLFFGGFAWLRLPQGARLGFIVGTSICTAMLIAVFIGTFLPVLFDRIRIDPAIATGPFVTTTVDVLGVLVYLGIASVLL